MSVDFYAEWPDGKKESMPLAPQHEAAVVWADFARKLGLKLYDGVFPMFLDPTNINQWIAEFEAIRAANAEADRPVDRLDRLLEHLRRLKDDKGWTATLG